MSYLPATLRLTAFAAAATLMIAPASAATVDPLALLQSYNAIALGDFTMQSSHVEGTMYVGGNLHSQNATDVNGDNQDPGAVGAALVVGGDVTGAEIRVLNGDADIGGSANGNVAMNGGGTLTESAIGIVGVSESMLGLSATLSAMGTTAGASYDSSDQNAPLTLGSGDADGFAVLNLTASEGASLLSGNINSLNTASYAGVFLNIAGSALTHTGNWNAQADNVILNFYEASTYSYTSGTLNFSVLAPLADVTTGGGGINGFVVGETITNSAELRPPFGNSSVNYAGALPEITTAAVPVPAAGLLLFGALAGLGLVRRRRRAA